MMGIKKISYMNSNIETYSGCQQRQLLNAGQTKDNTTEDAPCQLINRRFNNWNKAAKHKEQAGPLSMPSLQPGCSCKTVLKQV
jgi:hypothetical protein